jgi:hypothetical protein
MFDRGIFCILIALSLSLAVQSTSAQDGDPGVRPVLDDLDGEVEEGGSFNETSSLNETAPSGGAAIFGEGAEDTGEEGLIAVDDGNKTASEVLSPETPAGEIPGHPAAYGCPGAVYLAAEDVYVDLMEEMVYNDDHLVCEYLKGRGYEAEEFPAMAIIQFNISELVVEEDDVAVLVLKAEAIDKVGDENSGLILVPITSEWTEGSSFPALGLNLLSMISILEDSSEIDLRRIGMSFGQDRIVVFDVKELLKAAEGERLSFAVMAVADVDYRVSFRSRETGEGPAILIVPYPTAVSG